MCAAQNRHISAWLTVPPRWARVAPGPLSLGAREAAAMSNGAVKVAAATAAVLGLAFCGAPGGSAVPRAAAGARPTAHFTTCAAGTPSGARCGYVPVPLDRAHPNGRLIRIAFQF